MTDTIKPEALPDCSQTDNDSTDSNVCTFTSLEAIANAYYQRAIATVENGNLAEAAANLRFAIGTTPFSCVLHRTLAEILCRSDMMDEALAYGRQAVILDRNDAEARHILGVILASLGRHAEAVEQFTQALRLNPKHSFASNNLGATWETLGDPARAEAAYKTAIENDPANAEAHNNLGMVCLANGNLDAARSCFDAAIRERPAFPSAHHNLSGLKTYVPDDPEVAILQSLTPSAPHWPMDDQINFWFALGKAEHDCGHYDEAWAAFSQGNRLKSRTSSYNPKAIEFDVNTIVQTLDSQALHPKGTVRDATPIFIVGMPCSGTTLIQQILASHPDVHGAGDTRCFSALLEEISGDHYVKWLKSSSDDERAQLANRYLSQLRLTDSSSQWITDTTPGNCFLLGAIHAALPQATIIYCERDPMDTCLSCFQTLFKEPVPYAYDLGTLGHFTRQFERVMEHWKWILPEGRILTVQYESLVNDLEAGARQMLNHCGIPWNERCLSFHSHPRNAKSSSAALVRKPVYTTSVGRWRAYKHWLTPLHDALYK